MQSEILSFLFTHWPDQIIKPQRPFTENVSVHQIQTTVVKSNAMLLRETMIIPQALQALSCPWSSTPLNIQLWARSWSS